MKPSLVIVGAGLGGCFLADAMAEKWDVTVIELGTQPNQLQQRVKDVGKAAVTYPLLGAGLGGTTTVWHNGLVEIEEEVFQRKWPFHKAELSKYYAQAFHKLSGVAQLDIINATDILRQKFGAVGIPVNLLHQGLYYPRRRINAWHMLKLGKRVKLIKGEVIGFVTDDNVHVRQLRIKCGEQEIQLGGDVFVLAAGGLGTPLLLHQLAETVKLPALAQAGFNYEDHPSGFVAEFVFDAPIYKLWNFQVPSAKGNLRLPMVVTQNGLLVSFQLRPAVQFRPRNRVVSVLNELRNRPFNLRNYLRVFVHLDDLLDILSFKFGIHFPTRHYSLLMVAEQPPEVTCSVWRDKQDQYICRKWELSPAYLSTLQQAIHQALFQLGDKIKSVHVYPGWANDLFSSSHHSGTARMHVLPSHGVCDENGKIHGMTNLYVCDGSLIPASGYANTGLTIAALALRMADYLERRV